MCIILSKELEGLTGTINAFRNGFIVKIGSMVLMNLPKTAAGYQAYSKGF